MAFFDKFRMNIGGLRQTADRPSLIVALDGEDPGSRAAAARALSALGVSVVPDLLKGLENANRVSRARMLKALSSGGAPSLPLLLALILRASPPLQASITRAIAETGDSMFEALLLALRHKQPAVRRAGVLGIRGMGKKAVPPLAEAFRDESYSVRKEAAGALAALQWVPDELPEKVWYYFLLEDWAELVKLQAAAVPVLFKGLGSKDHRIRSESARALGKIRDSRVIPALVRAMGDPQADVRVRAAEALGESGNDRGKPALVKALDDLHHPVRMEAAWALDRLDWIPESDLERAGYLIAKEQWNDLVRMGKAAIPPLIRALEVDYSGVRTGASEALRQLGQPALDALYAAMRSDSPEIREQATVALDYIRSRNEENSTARPVQTASSNYDRELREGLAARKRIEDRIESASSPQSRPAHRGASPPARLEAVQPATSGKEINLAPEPVAQQPEDDEDVEKLLEERPETEEAWAGENIRPGPRRPVSLDELVPDMGAEQETDDKEHTEQKSTAPAKPKRTDLPEPETSTAPPEQASGKASFERYLNALQSDDAEIRAAAVAALRSLGTPAVGYLIAALSDPHDAVRIAAAEGLGEIGDPDGVDALVLLTGDAGPDIRGAAAAALGRIVDARAVGPLIRLFCDDYPEVRSVAAGAVAASGSDALEPLEAALESPVPTVRSTAAKSIGIVGNPRSIPSLVGHLEDPDRGVVAVVARVLGEFGHSAVEPLARMLCEGGIGGRLAAIDALERIEAESANGALEYALRDRDREIREKAAAVLLRRRARDAPGNRGGVAAGQEEQQEIGVLIAALKDESLEVQASAATRLIRMGRPAAEGLLMALKEEDREIQVAAAGVLGEMREAALEPLMDALRDSDRFVRLVAAQNLGNIGDTRAIEALSGSLKSERDSVVRTAVTEALGYVGSQQAIEPLALALQDRDEGVKVAAARSLGYIGDLSALEPLVLALHDVDDRVRYAALEALKDPGETMRRHLIGALRSGDGTFRAGVAEALEAGGWRPETGEERTLHLMAQGRWAEVERVGADALPVLAEALSDPLIEVRTNAVRAIDRIGGEGAVVPLIQALKDDALAVRKRAEWALIQMGEAVLPALDLAESEEEQPGIREGLQRIAREIRAKEGS
ncbi:putative oxidoreductase/HEAT repeat-containing protein [Methanoculleus chikugoensis]|uniref:Putative oxidoreductase/HEAT repeat-containing protein n=1 Tax=Methanoculleus chikugoensis TaxID=118126 RepID=A0A1M4MKC3_9EURY|nr:HEAT repeat domain-containing protein [Methanoculleus chikugoensis]SCL75292.1 putative oxidoreductase/HEAT repeat-containing protein [Methanoculleus chikugoensis]